MAFPSRLLLLLTFFLSYSNVQAFYVPGVAPVEFEISEKIEVKAVKMTSTQTQLPYEYYSLPFCKPEDGIIYKSENLGEVLRGDRIVNTPYDVRMGVNTPCRLLCNSPESPMIWQFDDQSLVSSRIAHDYYVHLLVDNLPCATKRSDSWTNFEHGYRLGFTSGGDTYIHNHLDLHFFYHQISNQNRYRVVGFQVNVHSVDYYEIKFDNKGQDMICTIPEDAKPQSTRSVDGGNLRLYFTYSVTWNASDISWASRWDSYLTMTDVEIHWFSIINSIVVVFVLSGLVALIIIRTIRRDIARYNADDMADEMTEQSGWKLVHGDVFRPPKYPRLFAAVIGSGVQIFLMSLLTILFAMLGMLSPASRGALMTCAIFFYACMGAIAGYISARVYKTIKGRQWKKAAFLTAVFYPGIVFGTCFILNLFIWNKSSSGAVPFTTMLSLLLIWFGISVPLIFLGYYMGYKKPAVQNPVRTNQIPRQVPEQMWYLHPYLSLLFSVLMAGLLPFAAVFIELFFIFTAIWQNQFYYLFGFLFLVFVILVICCGLIAIVMIYFQLCNEDYHWWWRCLATSGGCAVYVFLYSIYYFVTRLHITESVPMLLYFGYTGVMVLTFWLLTATIGFFSVYAFLRKIYSAIKIE